MLWWWNRDLFSSMLRSFVRRSLSFTSSSSRSLQQGSKWYDASWYVWMPGCMHSHTSMVLAGIIFIFGLLIKIFTKNEKEQANLIPNLCQKTEIHVTCQKETRVKRRRFDDTKPGNIKNFADPHTSQSSPAKTGEKIKLQKNFQK